MIKQFSAATFMVMAGLGLLIPNLFDVELELEDQQKRYSRPCIFLFLECAKSIRREQDSFLNNQPFYQKLVLDQGYWPDGLLTAPTDEDFKKDIQLAKDMGFNGCRKHQKIEDPRFLYWADQMGYIVWENAHQRYLILLMQ